MNFKYLLDSFVYELSTWVAAFSIVALVLVSIYFIL